MGKDHHSRGVKDRESDRSGRVDQNIFFFFKRRKKTWPAFNTSLSDYLRRSNSIKEAFVGLTPELRRRGGTLETHGPLPSAGRERSPSALHQTEIHRRPVNGRFCLTDLSGVLH